MPANKVTAEVVSIPNDTKGLTIKNEYPADAAATNSKTSIAI